MRDPSAFAKYLESFRSLPQLADRIAHVLQRLPDEVQQDFLGDPRFVVSVYNYEPGKGSTVFMAVPDGMNRSRSVVLKPRLDSCGEAFAYYVIAHEFAHAFLHNGPWGDITDIEEAADALAAHWGFPRPESSPWGMFWR